MNFLSVMFRWLTGKTLILLLLVVILVSLNFFWYGVIPLWTFVKYSGQQYEKKKDDLETQISEVQDNRLYAGVQIKERTANRPSVLEFWELDNYDAGTLALVRYAERLQDKERNLKSALLALEEPSIEKQLRAFWFLLQKNLSSLWGFVFIAVFMPDILLYLKMRREKSYSFSVEPEKKDFFWFLQGRMNRSRFCLCSFGVAVLLLLLLPVPFYFKSAENRSVLLLLSILTTALLVFEIIVSVKRLHDIERSGKHAWFLLIPVYNSYLSALLLFKKGSAERKYKGFF